MTFLLRYILNRGNVIMYEFYMNLSFKIFDRSENLFKIIYGVIIFWFLDMILKIDVYSFWISYDYVKMLGFL